MFKKESVSFCIIIIFNRLMIVSPEVAYIDPKAKSIKGLGPSFQICIVPMCVVLRLTNLALRKNVYLVDGRDTPC